MKNILDKMNEFGKHHEGLLSLLPISITIAGILLKVGFTLFITGMNYYNSMPLSLNIPFMADALTQIFIFIGIAIVCIFSNAWCYYTIKNNNRKEAVKKIFNYLFRIFLLEFIFFMFSENIPAKQFVFILVKENLGQFFLFYFACLFMVTFFGIFTGCSYKENSPLSKANNKISMFLFKLFGKIPQFICHFITVILFALLNFAPFWFGKSAAEDKKSFYIIEDENLVIMGEKNENYYCNRYIEKENIIYIAPAPIIVKSKTGISFSSRKFAKRNIGIPQNNTINDAINCPDKKSEEQ